MNVSSSAGKLLGTFAATPAPAFSEGASGTCYGLSLSGGTLYCFDFKSQNVVWNFAGDGQLSTAPLVVNGQVIKGSPSAELYILDGTTGATLWSANVGAGIPGPDEQNVSQPLTGLGAGENTLVAPAGDQISAFVTK